jgi:hypothetical protein
LHLVGPEQTKLIIEQFGDAAAASKARNPDPPRAMQRSGRAGDGARRDTCKARRFGLKLVRDQRYVGVGAENGWDCSGRRASVRAARNSSQPE